MQTLIKMYLKYSYKPEMPELDQFFWYETDDKGQRVMVKSIESNKKAYVRFINRTSRPVSVWWRDYNGMRVFYVTMRPNSYYNADTYISHPWEFTDAQTRERYVINNKDIFRAPECVANMLHRTTWYISIGVRTLVSTVMLTIASKLKNVEEVDTLGLPKALGDDMKTLLEQLLAPIVPLRRILPS